MGPTKAAPLQFLDQETQLIVNESYQLRWVPLSIICGLFLMESVERQSGRIAEVQKVCYRDSDRLLQV